MELAEAMIRAVMKVGLGLIEGKFGGGTVDNVNPA